MSSTSRNGTCKHCHQTAALTANRICRPCHAAYMREWRKTHKMTDEQRRKDNCRSYTAVLIKRGHMTRKPCILCGAEAQAHHPDYDRPRLVIWLCRPCHLDFHRWSEELPLPTKVSAA
jgi:hypothetical protein